jgi:glutaredoxin
MCVCAPPRTPVEGVTIYGRSRAEDVRRVQSFFEDRGVVFDYADIEQDADAANRAMELSGQRDAVVVAIGSRVFVGFDPSALDSALP